MSLNSPSPTPAPRPFPVALFVVSALVVAGASIAATAVYFELHPVKGSAPTGESGIPRGNNSTLSLEVNVTDDLGRSVTVPRDPSRVVELASNIMDSLAQLGLRSHVVGVDCASSAFGGLLGDYTPNQTSEWNLSASMCIQTYPGLAVDQLLAANPGVVLASTTVPLSDIEELSATYHLPTVVLAPATLGGIVVDVELLATIFAPSVNATPLVEQLQAGLAAAESVDANLSSNGASLPTVLLTYYVTAATDPSPGYWTFGPGTFGLSLAELAGATSISANATVAYPELPGSVVLAAQPEFIVYGTGFGLGLAQYAAGPDWSSFSAAGNGHAVGLDATLFTEAGPTMVLVGLHDLLHLFHPDLVPS